MHLDSWFEIELQPMYKDYSHEWVKRVEKKKTILEDEIYTLLTLG